MTQTIPTDLFVHRVFQKIVDINLLLRQFGPYSAITGF
jgi:hypothetical protein